MRFPHFPAIVRPGIVAGSFLVGLLSVGCKCQREQERPFTPFGVASTLPNPDAATSIADDKLGNDGTPTFKASKTIKVAPPKAQVKLHDRFIKAPEGQLWVQLVRLGTGSEAPVVGWAIPEESPLSEGALWAIEKPGGTARKLTGFPGFVPTAADCEPIVKVMHTGPHSVALDAKAHCKSTRLAPRAPNRSLKVFVPTRERAEVLALRLASPAPGEKLKLKINTQDQDQDGHDDIELTFTLRSKQSNREASARLLWLNRAAGLARDFSEPAKSLTAIGSIEVVRAKGKTTGPKVEGRIANARRLIAYMCEEASTYRITDNEGNPIRCGKLGLAPNFYLQAELEAELSQDRLAAAVAVLDRENWYPGVSATMHTRLTQRLAEKLPEKPTQRREVNVTPRAKLPTPQFSPLRFTTQGELLIQSRQGLFRFAQDDLQDVSEEQDDWPLVVAGPKGRRVLGMSYPCDSSLVMLQVQDRSGKLKSAWTAPWVAPRPGICAGGPANFYQPELRIINWTRRVPDALFGSFLLGEAKAGSPGSPVSPNGKNWVATSSLGLFVQKDTRAELWKLPKRSSSPSLCVINNAASQVACVENRKVVMYSTSTER